MPSQSSIRLKKNRFFLFVFFCFHTHSLTHTHYNYNIIPSTPLDSILFYSIRFDFSQLRPRHLFAAINKVDLLLSRDDGKTALEAAIVNIRKRLKNTKFKNSAIVPVSSMLPCPLNPSGGEKYGIKNLLDGLTSTIPFDALTNVDVLRKKRTPGHPFHFSIDHCFQIKGSGTVLTGTCLSGTLNLNESISLPELRITKKVKGIQKFHVASTSVSQGERAAICLTGVDSGKFERGWACWPPEEDSKSGMVRVKGVVVDVRKVRLRASASGKPSFGGLPRHIYKLFHTSKTKTTKNRPRSSSPARPPPPALSRGLVLA